MNRFDKNINHVLVLQGGGALGSYQAGAFQAMATEGYRPDYVAGISIGAINAALIAGNRPEDRLERLRTFWNLVSRGEALGNTWIDMIAPVLPRGHENDLRAAQAMFAGVQGFYTPRQPSPFLQKPGTVEALSFYSTEPLRDTLLELVDFDYLNSGEVRFAVGAVDVATGNQVYFDNTRQQIGPEHVMASGALPPGFPPVEIDGALYWDGGIVSNTPLQYVLDNHDRHQDMTVFQFDLFSAHGKLPETITDIETREKEIRFSSRTRFSTDQTAMLLEAREALQRLYDKLPKNLQKSDEVRVLMEAAHPGRMLLVQMIYERPDYEKSSRDYEFSRRSMQDHWDKGAADAQKTLRHARWIEKQADKSPLTVIDCNKLKDSPGKATA
ncbi:patatin-like phospholipase family protein [Paracoccus sp. (in: a-proteobacteria)]|uniref:patatin-like phospholipase family protein n=1 Tax=Paracoccus sp. TaxID=267 RepID=UPI003A835115